MRALTVMPGAANSASLEVVGEPFQRQGCVLVEAISLGICETDREIIAGHYGSPPPGEQRLILGHESLGRVVEAPADSGLVRGDMVVGIVRRPDPVPCDYCAADEWDMCRNGRYTECGIKERHGYGSERFRLDSKFAVKVDPALGRLGVLLEPASILAKAWDHVERIGRRTKTWRPRTLLVTGAGPIGMLAALMGADRALEVHVLDRHAGGAKADLVRALGGTYHTPGEAILERLRPDILLECTGAPGLISELLGGTSPAGITCLVGVSTPGHETTIDMGQLNRTLVLDNEVVLGVVNANRSHYESAAQSLLRADKTWLARLITRRVPVERWPEALERWPDDVKTVIDFDIAA